MKLGSYAEHDCLWSMGHVMSWHRPEIHGPSNHREIKLIVQLVFVEIFAAGTMSITTEIPDDHHRNVIPSHLLSLTVSSLVTAILYLDRSWMIRPYLYAPMFSVYSYSGNSIPACPNLQ